MKKLMFPVVLAVLLASIFGGATMVLADDGEDNFKKAGQQALQEREDALFSKLRDIEAYVPIAGADGVVTKDEMLTLRDKAKDFNRTKGEADKYLAFYGLKTYTELDKNLVKAANDYFGQHGLIKKDYYGEAKKLFVEATGQDTVVQRSIAVDGSSISLIILIALFFFMMITSIWVGAAKHKDTVLLSTVFGILFIVFLLVLFFQ